MKHYVIYHNVARRGELAEHEPGDSFAILTDRPVEGALGARIWLISGQGSPTAFQLHYVFAAERTESGDAYGFRHRLVGDQGSVFTPPVPLNLEAWFGRLKATQFFSHGLTQITDQNVVDGLLATLATSSKNGAPSIGGTLFPDEVSSPGSNSEGAVVQVSVNRYERDPSARLACLAEYGCVCSVCDCDFGERYGALGDGFIHVHHLTPISELGNDYQINPGRDMAPVCPNCHAMLHRTDPPLTIPGLAKIYQRQQRTNRRPIEGA